ncbi:hypothetical protein NBO_514g0007 [Nosema bombycis CQ1]|uniref:Uncharacterized protein n=1 Tax=Nosema bombycis (strain CQ1 / CVCC 102059) TaxID=578461 RepID=R0KPM6_NOSB1|nr:hypothetical protein NBO_514g0007 [Nosema bombycis CQ1]|eukprot:EOB12142.1 hypothetical protein NBO_514g0007 [Nosema bombycis CQ1]
MRIENLFPYTPLIFIQHSSPPHIHLPIPLPPTYPPLTPSLPPPFTTMTNTDNSEEYDDYFGFISKSTTEPKPVDPPFLQSFDEDITPLESTESILVNESSSDNFTIDLSLEESVDFPFDFSFKSNPSILWNKKEFYYNLDQYTRDKIWKVFERRLKTNQRPNIFDKDLNEDAFYSSYGITPSYDINFLWEDKYILRILNCERLRNLNMKFLNYNSVITKEIEKYVQKYKTSNEIESKTIYKAIVLQKKQIEILICKVRNYLSEMILKGEEGYYFLEKVYYVVFKKSPKLQEMNKMRCE